MKPADARRDQYRKMARQQGYRSRSAYKLKELHKSYRIIGPGFYVLDLGCAPGGWTQVAVQLAGNKGKVMGVDTAYVDDIENAYLHRGDISDGSIAEEVMEHFGRKVNAVICDLSPQVIGNWPLDHARQISLNHDAAKIMLQVLAYKGNAIFKVFDGEYANEFRDWLKRRFIKIHTTKPPASRKASSEVYYVCLGYRH
jgi:23S rRNA (uridine2552-2'-O)-methyltransferase